MIELLFAANHLVCFDIPISLLLDEDVEPQHLLLLITGHLVLAERFIVHGALSVCTASLGRECLHRLVRHGRASQHDQHHQFQYQRHYSSHC